MSPATSLQRGTRNPLPISCDNHSPALLISFFFLRAKPSAKHIGTKWRENNYSRISPQIMDEALTNLNEAALYNQTANSSRHDEPRSPRVPTGRHQEPIACYPSRPTRRGHGGQNPKFKETTRNKPPPKKHPPPLPPKKTPQKKNTLPLLPSKPPPPPPTPESNSDAAYLRQLPSASRLTRETTSRERRIHGGDVCTAAPGVRTDDPSCRSTTSASSSAGTVVLTTFGCN